MNKKHIVLVDMDGTLTEPRGPFDRALLEPLRELSKNVEIGIVTGSDINYINSQMEILLRFSEVRYRTHLLPCNGTKHYIPPKHQDDTFRLVHEVDMIKHLGLDSFKQIMMLLSYRQSEACYLPIPLTGHFINYRGSMINWSPIGRNANPIQRKLFAEYDKKLDPSYRMRELRKLQYKIDLRCSKPVVVKLGGETSFDIYPKGWDKTYALRHFEDYTCWFVGDRCGIGGNDAEIYDKLATERRAFKTSGPEETGRIISRHLNFGS